MKEKILKGWKSHSDNNLANFIINGVITIADLEKVVSEDKDVKGLERLKKIRASLKKKEDEMWKAAQEANTVEALLDIINLFGEGGAYYNDAREALNQKDADFWKRVEEYPLEETLKEYASLFPEGLYIDKCNEYLQDLPWFQTKIKNTIAAYEDYRKKYPGKHDREIDEAIEIINDEQDWETACKNGTTEAYKEYLRKHPRGKHAQEAQKRIDNVSGEDLFINELMVDINKYSVDELKYKLDNNVTTWGRLEKFFENRLSEAVENEQNNYYSAQVIKDSVQKWTKEKTDNGNFLSEDEIVDFKKEQIKKFAKLQVEAIKKYKRPNQLPVVYDIHELPRGYTEVYFWGLRGTGKTCAIGATIGYLQNVRKSINPIICPGEKYLHQLQNLFRDNGKVCLLPPGTLTKNLPAMAFSFKDNKEASHRTMMIDVAGEVFAGIFKMEHGIKVEETEQDAIEHLKSCLNDNYNSKIHFFIVEYGEKEEMLNINGYGEASKAQIMQSLVSYFSKNKLFKRSSVSMNILVTKCDRIKEGDSKEQAWNFVDNGPWASFKNGLNDVAEASHLKGIDVISFSIGEVFAQDLCIFNPADAEKIVSEIEEHTHGFLSTFWGKLIDLFRK